MVDLAQQLWNELGEVARRQIEASLKKPTHFVGLKRTYKEVTMIHDAPVRAVDPAPHDSPMRAQLGALDSRIDNLTHNIERLKHRLDDVLRTTKHEPGAQIEESAKAGPSLDVSYALLELDRMTAKINDLSVTIEDICDRLVT